MPDACCVVEGLQCGNFNSKELGGKGTIPSFTMKQKVILMYKLSIGCKCTVGVIVSKWSK